MKFRGIDLFEDVVLFFEVLYDVGLVVGVITHGLTVKQAEKLILKAPQATLLK